MKGMNVMTTVLVESCNIVLGLELTETKLGLRLLDPELRSGIPYNPGGGGGVVVVVVVVVVGLVVLAGITGGTGWQKNSMIKTIYIYIYM